MAIDNKRSAELSEKIDGEVCGSDVHTWDTLTEFEAEIMASFEEKEELTEEEYQYCSERLQTYWQDNDGDNQDNDCDE